MKKKTLEKLLLEHYGITVPMPRQATTNSNLYIWTVDSPNGNGKKLELSFVVGHPFRPEFWRGDRELVKSVETAFGEGLLQIYLFGEIDAAEIPTHDQRQKVYEELSGN